MKGSGTALNKVMILFTDADIDLMHWRHHAAMLGVKAFALYALVRLAHFWQLLLRVILLTPKRQRTSVSLMAWRHMHKVYMIVTWVFKCSGIMISPFGWRTVVKWFVLSTRNQRVVGWNPTRCICPQTWHFDHHCLSKPRAPFHKGLRLIASFFNTQFAIELRFILIVRLILTLCEMGPRYYEWVPGTW